MSVPDPRILQEEYERELADFIESVRSGKAFSDRATAERWSIRLVGALLPLQQCHRVDRHGRCPICRANPRWWWPWPKRVPCTVHAALSFSLRQPERFVLSAITDNPATVRHRS
ncbi:MAG: hypothetical protein ACRDSR_27125 [Pseudonocardiaceae bacterium]